MTISNEALSETFIADAIFEIKVDKRPSLDEKLQYTRVAQRAITVILDGFVEGTSNSQKIILTNEARKFINEQAYADLIAPCTEWSCLVTKGNVTRCETRIYAMRANAYLRLSCLNKRSRHWTKIALYAGSRKHRTTAIYAERGHV